MMICVYTKLFLSVALMVLLDRSRCFVPRLASFVPDFLSALQSASTAMTAYKVSSIIIVYWFVHLNALKWPIWTFEQVTYYLIMSILL